jgi:hypothetical protein
MNSAQQIVVERPVVLLQSLFDELEVDILARANRRLGKTLYHPPGLQNRKQPPATLPT